MRNALAPEILKAGWMFDHEDEFAGDRIYPAWSQAKTIPMRDFRIMADGTFCIHNSWKNETDATFQSFNALRSYVAEHGTVIPAGVNAWD